MGTLYVIATPIGNMGDLSFRAVEVMKTLDLLLCEDTRVTGGLLKRYGLTVPMESYREQVHERKLAGIVGRLEEGKAVGLVSDAGTPGISDPGSWLIRDILRLAPETKVIPIPGPSAAVTALSASGLLTDSFVFLGFPPHKKGRSRFFREAMEEKHTVVLYESPHRIVKALDAVAEIDPNRPICLARELTKMHETFYRGTVTEVKGKLLAGSLKGEFVLLIAPVDKK
ncbi:16S rRNA (cytidine(1402)-2'-O)-methyltransferase [Candidatus Uhrbacteria bacterium]|nr:16S rRNA (cytidine(1402)-2'-O)-methyltransferase [Candidatus Uhrbacteria bacterium]